MTAVVAARRLRVRLSRMEWAAVGAVCAGPAVPGPAFGVEGDEAGPVRPRWAMLGAVGWVLLLGGVAERLPSGGGRRFGFGVVEVAVRLIDGVTPGVFRNPAAYALLLRGGAAFRLPTSALQRGSVTTSTAGLVLGETVADRRGVARGPYAAGPGWPTVLGFAVAVAGAPAL